MTGIWGDLDEIEAGIRGKRLPRTEGYPLGAAVWELAPGSEGVDYHVHHGTEELLIVLRGRPTLRTADGERQLEEGDVVHFPPGPQGAHTVLNRTDAATFVAGAKTLSQRGEPFFVRLPFPEDG